MPDYETEEQLREELLEIVPDVSQFFLKTIKNSRTNVRTMLYIFNRLCYTIHLITQLLWTEKFIPSTEQQLRLLGCKKRK